MRLGTIPSATPAIYALHYADLVARMAGFRVGTWDLLTEPRDDVVGKFGLPGKILESSIAAITNLVKVQYGNVPADAARPDPPSVAVLASLVPLVLLALAALGTLGALPDLLAVGFLFAAA